MYSWKTNRESATCWLPQRQSRGVVLPLLSSKLTHGDLSDICCCSIDPGVVQELTVATGKFSYDAKKKSVSIESFPMCFKHFGKATYSGDPANGQDVLADLETKLKKLSDGVGGSGGNSKQKPTTKKKSNMS